MIKAKSISDKFWILKEGNIKIGEVNNTQAGYTISIKGKSAVFQTLDAVKFNTGIEFVSVSHQVIQCANLVHGYPTSSKSYNKLWNIKSKLPLYTKSLDSKSWFAAGYYLVKIKGTWKPILSPKLIILQRNQYHGPYKTNPSNDSH
jgi:hypothetical protein